MRTPSVRTGGESGFVKRQGTLLIYPDPVHLLRAFLLSCALVFGAFAALRLLLNTLSGRK